MHIFKKILAATTCLFLAVSAVSAPAAFAAENRCGNTSTRLISCGTDKTGSAAINELIRIIVIAMTAIIGILATGGIAYAAVLYSSARDSQTQIDQAKTIIRNIVIGLLMYVFMVAIINWLIPGSVIG